MVHLPRNVPRSLVGASLAAAAVLSGACSGGSSGGVDPALVHTVRLSDMSVRIRERGEISAARDTKIVSELEGRATLIYLVPEGTMVTEGTKVAEMDASIIVEKRTLEEIVVARAEAALQQARKNVEIVEKELLAAEMAAESALEIAKLRARKLVGQPRTEGENGEPEGTNRQVVDELRALVADDSALEIHAPVPEGAEASEEIQAALDRAERARRPVSTDLVPKVLQLFETEANLDLQMGEMGNQILQQVSQINLARSDLEVAADTLSFSEQLTAEGFMTRNELSRDRITHRRRIAEMNLAWNNLDLLVNYTLPESKITARQEVSNAELTLESVRAGSEARRVREASELTSAESEFEIAKQRLATWNEQIDKAVLHAPTDGLVVYGRYDWDEPVYEGMEIRERQEVIILPDVSTMVAELLVHEAQVDQVAVGQRASLSIDAFPEREFGARVVSVSTLPDIRGSWRRDVKVYAVRVELDGSNVGGDLRPGMNSTIEIDVGTLVDVIAIPLPALDRVEDRHYVWRLGADGPVATRVQVGANNLTHVVIEEGLAVGDRILLVPPPGAELPDDELQPSTADDGVTSDVDGVGGRGDAEGSRPSDGGSGDGAAEGDPEGVTAVVTAAPSDDESAAE